MAIITGIKTYKISLLKNNRVDIVFDCQDQFAAIKFYEELKQNSDSGKFNMSFEVDKKA